MQSDLLPTTRSGWSSGKSYTWFKSFCIVAENQDQCLSSPSCKETWWLRLDHLLKFPWPWELDRTGAERCIGRCLKKRLLLLLCVEVYCLEWKISPVWLRLILGMGVNRMVEDILFPEIVCNSFSLSKYFSAFEASEIQSYICSPPQECQWQPQRRSVWPSSVQKYFSSFW